MRRKTIDLNVDVGEGSEHDDGLLEFATSVNIACGWHAGDASTMRRLAQEALRRGIAVGAHPSFPDRENFGRTMMNLPRDEVYAGIQYQVGALAAIVYALGGTVSHVKPHGALYNEAERDEELARTIVHAVQDLDPDLMLFGLAGGQLVRVAREAGMVAVEEGFADRSYTTDGKLVPPCEPGALLEANDAVRAQVVSLVRDQRVRSRDGCWVPVRAETLCLHGDGPHVVGFARHIRDGLCEAGFGVPAVGRRSPSHGGSG